MTHDARPDPERFLAEANAEAGGTATGRGRLKIFLGAAPGVGKTYAMLEEAAARARAGTDVVVGLAETHGRQETAALLAQLKQFLVEFSRIGHAAELFKMLVRGRMN